MQILLHIAHAVAPLPLLVCNPSKNRTIAAQIAFSHSKKASKGLLLELVSFLLSAALLVLACLIVSGLGHTAPSASAGSATAAACSFLLRALASSVAAPVASAAWRAAFARASAAAALDLRSSSGAASLSAEASAMSDSDSRNDAGSAAGWLERQAEIQALAVAALTVASELCGVRATLPSGASAVRTAAGWGAGGIGPGFAGSAATSLGGLEALYSCMRLEQTHHRDWRRC
jgi:hypothetical protein